MADSTQRAELTREVEWMKDSLFHTVLEMHNQLIELRRNFAKVQSQLVESEEKRDKAETELQSMKEDLEAQRKAAQNQDQRVSEVSDSSQFHQDASSYLANFFFPNSLSACSKP